MIVIDTKLEWLYWQLIISRLIKTTFYMKSNIPISALLNQT